MARIDRRLFQISAGMLLTVSPAFSGEQDASLSQALVSYQQHDYSQAYKLFADSAGKNPRDGTAWLYAANCLYEMGNVSSAAKLYSYVRQKFPGTRNSLLAEQMLKRVEGKASNTVPATSTAEGGAPRSTLDADEDRIKASANSGPDDCSDLLEIVRPLYGHPSVTDGTVSAVQRTVKSLSPNVLRILRKNGAKVVLTTTLIDKEPSLKNREGRGYDGYTYKSCPGMFWHNKIYLCERTLDESDDSVKEPMLLSSILGTFLHECGHALDQYCGDLSSTEEFKHAYLLDSGKIDADTKVELAYFLQKSEAGQQECCGELIGILLGKTDKKADKMREAFPLTLRYLRGKINP